jgi:diguanylate cyclase (GGDEF)-like protein
MMDLDGLKAVNDRFGHYHGDRALRAVGETVRAGVRRIDTAARYGGDEFVVVLPETEPTGAFVLAEKIRVGVRDRVIKADGLDVRASLSVGIVVYPRDGRTVDDLMIAADTTMYRSKRQGRDRVVGSWVANGGGLGSMATAAVVASVGVSVATTIGAAAETPHAPAPNLPSVPAGEGRADSV